MKTTYFRPSIHGWPFDNKWRKSIVFEGVTIPMGFCGGMCWRALKRFYNAERIPRNTPDPSEGDTLYDEIWQTQVDSVPLDTLEKIYLWQQRPDHSSRTDVLHSLGDKTQKEWPSVKSSLDANKPVTITLIADSNNRNPVKLKDSHRVIAYAYKVNATTQGDGSPEGADHKVTMRIYDPNYHDKDDVELTFYKGAKKNNIRLRHNYTNKDDKYHGFFLDDKDSRSYNYSDATSLHIEKCEQTAIISATRVKYDLKFLWTCRFIPYFEIFVRGVSWKFNDGPNQAMSKYEPVDEYIKQSHSRNGNLTVNLELPRSISTVGVRLLDDTDFYDSIVVDAKPVIKCYPYIRSRALGDALCISDYDIKDADLFVKDPNPSDAEVQQLDTSEFRWVMAVPERHEDLRRIQDPQDDLSTAYVSATEKKLLGNVIVPIFANFEEKNLAAPTVKSGVVKTITGGVITNTITINPLSDNLQKIFDGFTNNPADYDNDTTVELRYQSRDNFGVAAHGLAYFYGKSILYELCTATANVFNPAKLAKLEVIARKMVEWGLIEVTIEPPSGRVGPRPDLFKLIKKLRSNRQLQNIIDSKFKSTWSDKNAWKRVWKDQSELLKLTGKGTSIHVGDKTKKGQVLEAVKLHSEEQQRIYDAVVLNVMTKSTINRIQHDQNAMRILKSL